jgi:hypothetical protein
MCETFLVGGGVSSFLSHVGQNIWPHIGTRMFATSLVISGQCRTWQFSLQEAQVILHVLQPKTRTRRTLCLILG